MNKIFRTWTFKWWEVGFLKVCLISLGIMLGLYFYESIVGMVWIWWALFVAPAIYFIIKFLMDQPEEPAPTKKEPVVFNKAPTAKEPLPVNKEVPPVAKYTPPVNKEPMPVNKEPVKEPVQAPKEQTPFNNVNKGPIPVVNNKETTPPVQGNMPLK